ncbi:TPR-like protein [Melanomma pulvis-pyrius CBS 109.77]|uniref:TPR-like protein n=1 Tax=Melanomma pulvis-pyrius CBS 109.77 TaxID=1314802 RepID=A0A6A6WV02_9PLEO|nr:TPR-like protein [Melanomma pulvis-pyrius CBS 109.77]
MAEALAGLSLAANILQVVQFSTAVIARLEDYRSRTGSLPDTYDHINNKLPALIHKLKETEAAATKGAFSEDDRRVLLPIVAGCEKQIKALGEVLAKALPKNEDSGIKRGFKAVGSLRYDTRVEKMAKEIESYVVTLTYFAVATKNFEPLPRPPPDATCPFPRDPHFVHRAVLDDVISKQQPGSKVALVGLGGIGKSQIANEYAHRVRDTSPSTWVFWVYADSLASFEDDYKRIAEKVGIVGWNDKDANIAKLVHTWFTNEANGNWILIIDNADDLDVFKATPSHSVTASNETGRTAPSTVPTPQLQDFIPSSRNGSILITSRNRDVAFHFTCSYPQILPVEPMSESEATALLKSKLVGTFAHDEMVELVKALCYMPLAISQAAAYISQRAPRESVKTYLERMKKGDKEAGQLLENDLPEAGRDRQRTNSIVATWQITFQYVRKTKPSAARLLSLICLFNGQRVPTPLLETEYIGNIMTTEMPVSSTVPWWKRRGGFRHRKQQAEMPKPNYDFKDDWLTLTDLSLVDSQPPGLWLTMHPLVQFTTRKWLELHGELKVWKNIYFTLLKICFLPRHVATIDEEDLMYTFLFSHAEAAIAYRPAGGEELENWAIVMYKAGAYARPGDAYAAEKMNRAALEVFQVVRGVEDEHTLRAASQLGWALNWLRKHEEAEEIYRRVLECRLRVLGPDHKNTIRSLHSVASTLMLQKKFEDAYAMHMRAFDAEERKFGLAHEMFYVRISLTALEYLLDHAFKQATAVQRRKFETKRKATGKEDDDEHHYLGTYLQHEGKYHEAEAHHRFALERRLERLGPEHAKTVESQVEVAHALKGQTRYKEAVILYRQALDHCAKPQEEKDEYTLSIMEHLANGLAKEGTFEEAEELSYQVIEGRMKLLQTNMSNLFEGFHTLADVLYEQNRYEEALPYYETAYFGQEEHTGKDHEDTEEFLRDYTKVKEMIEGKSKDKAPDGQLRTDAVALEITADSMGM